MNIRRFLLTGIALLMLLLAGTLGAYAQKETPRWVKKGAKELNDNRSNTSYQFMVFSTHDSDLQRITSNNSLVLADYVQHSLGARPSSIRVTEDPNDPNLYRVSYETSGNRQHWIIALLVDSSFVFDEDEDDFYQYEFYQLFAISTPDTYPSYDEFYITKKYKSKAVELSLVPGLGQIYKGQSTKGYVIMGGEIALIGGALYFENERRYCHNRYTSDPYDPGHDSWRKKSKSWGAMRNVSIGCAVALYVYNLLDAAYSNGISQVVVKKRYGAGMSFLPYLDTEGAGMSLAITF